MISSQNTMDAFRGVVPAVMTVCKTAGEPDFDLCAEHCCSLVERGCDALFIGGSTGELSLMNVEQRRQLTRCAVQAVDGSAPIAMGISGSGLDETLRNAQFAAEDGADLGIAMPPYIFSFGLDELRHYFYKLADESPLPIGIYHRNWGAGFDSEALHVMAGHPNIKLIKFNSIESEEWSCIQQALAGDDVILLQGREPGFRMALEQGCDGVISALCNVVPEWHRQMIDAHREGDTRMVAKIQDRLDNLIQIFRQPECAISFSAWNYTLRYGAYRRGWLPMTTNMMPGYTPSESFKQRCAELWEEGFEAVER